MTDKKQNTNGTTRPTMNDLQRTMHSRREILAGAGAVAGAGILGTAAAQNDDEDGGEEPAPAEIPAPFDQPNTDVDVLNYALTLEALEDTFYERGLGQFSEDDLTSVSSLEGRSEAQENVLGYFEQISEHEATHTEQITRVIETLGAEPIDVPEFEFNFESAAQFIETAQILENTGVSAYAGAAPRIESPDVLSAALSIHSVEARHAAVLNELNAGSPFPDAFDPAATIPDVLEAIQPFIAGEISEPSTETPTETETGAPTETETGTSTDTETGIGTDTEIGTETVTENVTGTPTENGE